ncbi:FAD-dependent oxidoreductase [Palleronia sediminis]|uniref:FAD-dependent oxidoreductase n=1 Tax=Palleronia sediminis TaxID=2547833 RepID=A0A4R6A7D0_9RHOB|nr:FAD-dependent oxidoreductase [Palleronia sediminis]TDL78088.1 FAD-dependent oxidoreductase [Palleronia sediminis]
MTETARVVIIGGGVVGVSCLYHLAQRGWTDCTLLEKNELTAGSTWHAAGNCPTFSTSLGMTKLQRYSMELYRGLEAATGTPLTYNVTGAIRLAHTDDRMREFEHVAAWGRKLGMPTEMMTVADMREAYPFLETHDLVGGFWDAHDGDADPASLTGALAAGARALGATIHRFRPATGVTRKGGEWIVHTAQGDIRCRYVVNAGGYYAQRIGEWFRPHGGRTVPMTVLQHQYLLTEEIPEIAEWTRENGRKLPLVRDPDVSYYLRQEKTGLNLGPYERGGQPFWTDAPMPEDFSFQLFPDDLDRLEPYIEDAMARVPLLGTAGISRVINGPIPYAPDGLPLIGPMPGVPDAFEACVFTFGIAQAGGAGKLLTDWIVEGAPEWDAWSMDPRRFTGWVDQAAADAMGLQVYRHEYALQHPHHAWPAGRDKRLSPAHDRIKAAGGRMGAFGGWERALWYARPGDDTTEAATETFARHGPWWGAVADEVAAVRDGVGVIDICGFTRFELSGAGAGDWLAGRIAGRLPRTGRMGLAYFADARGRCLTEMSVLRHDEDAFTLITAAAAQWHDRDVLTRDLRDGLTLVDRTDEVSTLLVTGPEARALLTGIGTTADLSAPWLSHQRAEVAGIGCTLARVSFAGDLGWEIHARPADIPALWDAVTGAGARPFGMMALDSMRMEKGWLSWKGDLSTDYTLEELGLARFMRHPGTPERRIALLEHDGAFDPLPMSNVLSGDSIVGEVTTAAFGHRVGKPLALAMLPVDLAAPGTSLSIDIFGRPAQARVLPGAAWDADFTRIRS